MATLVRAESTLRPLLEELLDTFARAHGLSGREREVIRLATMACHDKQIAEQLGVSVKTIEVFWRRIYEKTGWRGHCAVLAGVIRFVSSAPSAPCAVCESESSSARSSVPRE